MKKISGSWILDDETYVKADKKQIPGHKNYIAKELLGVANQHKYIKLDLINSPEK